MSEGITFSSITLRTPFLKNKYSLVSLILGFVLLLDQVTKHLIETRVQLYEKIAVIPHFFNLTHVRNKGAAFSLLSDAPEPFRSLFFITMSLLALVAIAVIIRKTREWLPVLSYSLIAGGAVGNLIDRIRYGEVVDFIQWYIKSYYWPSFNVADSAISVGATLLAIDILLKYKKEGADIDLQAAK